MDTDALIGRLSREVAPVRRLPPAWLRALIWLAVAAPWVALVVAVHGMRVAPDVMLSDHRLLLEQAATLVTAVTAAAAALALTVPGASGRIVWIPLSSLAVWLLSVGHGCWQDWVRFGPDGLALRIDWDCLPPSLWIATVPALALGAMLRRGAPLAPRRTAALAGLAIAAVANFGLQFFHAGDASIMLLVWHVGAAAALAAIGAWLGPKLLLWPRSLSPDHA